MSNVKPVKEILETLLAIKVSLRDTAEPSIIKQLDEVIVEIQRISEANESSEISIAKILDLLGKFFSTLPSVVELLELLSG